MRTIIYGWLLLFSYCLFAATTEQTDREITSKSLLEAELEINHAPLMPLSPQFSLDLTVANQQLAALDAQEQPQRNKRLFQEHQFPWTLLGIAAFMGLAGVIWKQRRNAAVQQPPSIPLTGLEKVKHDLANLPLPHQLSEAQLHTFAIQLTNILRQYATDKWSLPFIAYTTEDVEEAFNQLPLSDQFKELYLPLLKWGDRVKFAQHSPSSEECQEALEKMLILIQEN